MATSYADSAQAREWDRRYDDWGRDKKPRVDEFHDYEGSAQKRSQLLADREVRELAERAARAKRVAAATDAIGEFWGLKEKSA